MLGNSFTFFCDMPQMLTALLNAEVIHHTRGGAHLAEQLNPETEMGARTQAALRDEKWDYVILQEYSTGPIVSPERFQESVRALCGQIRKNGAVPILYATWAFKKDGKKLIESNLDYEEMFHGLYDAYHRTAEENDALIADVGKAFYENADTLELYASDDYHPSPEGSRLAAETIASVIRKCEKEVAEIRGYCVPYVDETDNRIRVLRLYEILRKYTDEEHTLSTNQIRRMLEERYGMAIHRTTLPRDIEVLRAAGIEVTQVRHKALHYYLADRSFSIPELRLLIDAVQSSKFITENKSRELIEKLELDIKPNALSLKLNVNAGKLYNLYFVQYSNKRTHKGRKITLRYDENHPIVIEPEPIVEEAPTIPDEEQDTGSLRVVKEYTISSENINEYAGEDYDRAYGLKSIKLRYFNVAGADEQIRIGEWHEPETHLIPNIIKSTFGEGKTFKIFGDDYNTPDGTCIRDYVNVEDLAEAHRLALEYLKKENKSNVFNLGTEKGDSVKNVFDVCEKVLNKKISVEVVSRRDGDAEALYANANKVKTILGWKPQRTIEDSIRTAYKWEEKMEQK